MKQHILWSLTSFCSSSGKASVNRVIKKCRGAILAVMSESSSLAASLKCFSPYNLWNSRYFPKKEEMFYSATLDCDEKRYILTAAHTWITSDLMLM